MAKSIHSITTVLSSTANSLCHHYTNRSSNYMGEWGTHVFPTDKSTFSPSGRAFRGLEDISRTVPFPIQAHAHAHAHAHRDRRYRPQQQHLKQLQQAGHLNAPNVKHFLRAWQQLQLRLQLGLRTRIRQQQLAVKVVVVAVFTRYAVFVGSRDCRIFFSLVFVVTLSISRMNLERWRMKSGYSSRLQ